MASLTEKNCVHCTVNRCDQIILLARILAQFTVALRVFASMMILSSALALLPPLHRSPVEILVILSGQVISLITVISHLIGEACEPLMDSSRMFE